MTDFFLPNAVHFTFTGIKTELNKDKIEKKIPVGMPIWKKITTDNFTQYIDTKHKGHAIITGKMSGITVFDFDKLESYNKLVTDFPDIKKYFTVKTKKGVHVYCLYDDTIKTTTNCFYDYDAVDIRNDDSIIFSPPTAYKMLDGKIAKYEFVGGDILPVPEFLKSNLKQFNNTIEPVKKQAEVEKTETTEKTTKRQSDKTILRDLHYIRDAVSKGYLDDKVTDYCDWRDVGFVIHYTCDGRPNMLEEGFTIFDEFSKRNEEKYDEKYVIEFWKKIKHDTSKPLTIRTLRKWVQKKRMEDDDILFAETDNEAGKLVYEMIKEKIVFCTKTLYFKKGNIWITDIHEIECALLDVVLNSNIYKRDDKGEPIPYVQNVSPAKKVVECVIKTYARANSDDDFYSQFMDSTRGKLCFKNGVLDFTTKKFTRWEDIQPEDEVFTTFVISRDFNPLRNDDVIAQVHREVFDAIFDSDAERAIHFFSRSMAGHVEDKTWGLFIGLRNCGKGVIENFFKNTFQQYIHALSSDLFLFERQGGAMSDTKKLSWLMDLEFARLTFTQEASFDATNKNVKIDGNKLKKICSGGDYHTARKNFKDEREFKIQSGLMVNANDIPKIEPADAFETVCSFSSSKQFKPKEFIDDARASGASDFEMKLYHVADPILKTEKCSRVDWMDALIHILLDGYKPFSAPKKNVFKTDDDCDNIVRKFLNDFEITNDKEDKTEISVISDWCTENNVSYKMKINPLLKTWNCQDKRTTTMRYKSGIRVRTQEKQE
jgi:hypothetical protein